MNAPEHQDIVIYALTDDQIATMTLIGGDEITERIEIALCCPTPPSLLKMNPGLHPNVVHRHKCPVLMYRGRLRRIRPKGGRGGQPRAHTAAKIAVRDSSLTYSNPCRSTALCWRKESAMGKVYDTPSEVTADSGEVQMDGPDGVAVALTPDAAAETSDRLLESAVKAQGQKIQARREEEDREARRR